MARNAIIFKFIKLIMPITVVVENSDGYILPFKLNSVLKLKYETLNVLLTMYLARSQTVVLCNKCHHHLNFAFIQNFTM